MRSFPAVRIAAPAALIATLAACTSGGSGAPGTSDAPTSSASSPNVTRATSSRPAPPTSTARSTAPSTAASTKPATGDGVLVSKADTLCALGNAYRKAHPFPVAHFDPTNPAVSDLPKVATYLRAEPDVLGRLLRLDLPFGVATALTQQQKNVSARIAAAANSDPQSFAHAAQDDRVVTASLLTAAKRGGLAPATACLTYFRG